MQVKLTDSGEIQFLDGDHINRNSLNRKTLIVIPETPLATRESLWVQFGDNQNFEDVNANILEPISLSAESDGYKTTFPDEVIQKAGTWYMTLAVRVYSTDGSKFSSQLTSDKVSFAVNDSYPMDDNGYISNGTLQNAWEQIKTAEQSAQNSADEAGQSAQEAADTVANGKEEITDLINGANTSLNDIVSNAQQSFSQALTQAQAAQTAAENAQTAAENAQASALDSKSWAEIYKNNALAAQNAAQSAESAAQQSATQAQNSQMAAASSASSASSSASQAAQSANNASASAVAAQGYMEQAKEYAQKEYQIYDSFSALPIPGNSAYIYLVPSTSGVANDDYSEYLWISNTNQYEYVGSLNDVDLANYAQVNGNYPNMSVGAANRLSRQIYIGVSSGAPGWYKVGHISAADIVSQGNNVATSSVSVIFLVNGMNGTGTRSDIQPSGLLEVDSRIASDLIDNTEGYTGVKVLAGNLIAEDYCVKFDDTRENLYLYKNMSAQYMAVEFVVVSEQYGTYPTKAFVFDGTFESAEMPVGGIVGINVNKAAYDGNGNNIAQTYAMQNGSYSGLTAGRAYRLSQSFKFAASNQSGGTVGWWKIATVSGAKLTQVTGVSSYSAVLLINGLNPVNESFGGLIEVDCRVESGVISSLAVNLSPKILCGGLTESEICVTVNTETNELNVYLLADGSYQAYSITVIDESYLVVLQPSQSAITLDGAFYSVQAPANAVYAVNVNRASYDGAGNEIATTYAQQNGSYPNLGAGYLPQIFCTIDTTNLGWWKVGEFPLAAINYIASISIQFDINGVQTVLGNPPNSANSGTLEWEIRTTSGGAYDFQQLSVLSGCLSLTEFCCAYDSVNNKAVLYVNLATNYRSYKITKISEQVSGASATLFLFEFANQYTGSASTPSGAIYPVNRNNAAYDGEGNNIAQTYAPKSEIPFGFEQINLSPNIYHQLEDGYVYLFNAGIYNSAGFEITDSIVTYTMQAGSIFVKLNGPSSTILYRGFNGSATPSEVSGLSVSQANYTGSGGTWYWGIKTTYSAGGKLYRMKLS